MVSLDDLREEMKKRLEIDKQLKNVEVNADSIDEALADAAIQFDTKTKNLEYEVVEKGSKGFFGIGKKNWKIRIYQSPESLIEKQKSSNLDMFGNEIVGDITPVVENRVLFTLTNEIIGNMDVSEVNKIKTMPITTEPTFPKLTFETCPDLPVTVVYCFLPVVDN